MARTLATFVLTRIDRLLKRCSGMIVE